MKIKRSLFQLLSTFLLSFGCEEVVTPPEIENIDNLLVVNGILSPLDSVYDVEVTWSNPSFGILPSFDEEYVRNAEVSITDGNTSATFAYDENWRLYRLEAAQFPLEPGTTYVLTAEADGQAITSSVTTMQQIPEIDSYEFRNNFRLSVQWTDNPGTENYYSVRAFLKREAPDFTNIFSYFFDSGFISDASRDGTILQDIGEGFDTPQSQDSLFITLYSYDELYVDYFEILDNYIGDDPFSEPLQLPSNIEGGLGIFAIVQQSDFKVRVQ